MDEVIPPAPHAAFFRSIFAGFGKRPLAAVTAAFLIFRLPSVPMSTRDRADKQLLACQLDS